MFWTDEKVEELCKLWDKGLTANEIAKKLGVTKNAIVGKVHRLCLKARPSPIKPKTEETEESQKTILNEFEDETQNIEDVAEHETVEVAIVEVTETNKNTDGIIKLIDLDSHTCRWPVGDPRDDDFGFCGKKVRAGQTYCDEHSAMAYVKAVRR